jgi:endonuclease-3
MPLIILKIKDLKGYLLMSNNKMNHISQIMRILEKKYPVATTTLNSMRGNASAFHILISCLLSLRTQDKNTEKASKSLFAVANTPKEILKLPTKKLEKLIYSSGHYKKKARVLKSVSKEILTRFHGKVPSTEEELLSIKGIGRKTANIVLSFAFGKAVIPVDVHVHVISNRLGWTKSKNPEGTEKQLMEILDKKFWYEINSQFVQLGKEFCITISPKCSVCPIKEYCPKVEVKRSR